MNLEGERVGILGVDTTRNDLLCEQTYSFFYLASPKMCVCTFSSIVRNLFHVMLQYSCHLLNRVHFNHVFMMIISLSTVSETCNHTMLQKHLFI